MVFGIKLAVLRFSIGYVCINHDVVFLVFEYEYCGIEIYICCHQSRTKSTPHLLIPKC